MTVKLMFKAALINIFIYTMDQSTMCNVTVVTRSDETTNNYHCSSPQLYESSFSSLVWFYSPQLY